MKKLAFYSFILVFFLMNPGCKKDKTETGTPVFSAKVEGVDWVASEVTGYASSVSASTIITATNTQGEQIIIAFNSHDTGTVTYTNDDPFSYANYATTETEYSTMYNSTPEGEVIVTTFDKSKSIISGTFHFTAKNSAGQKKIITEGKFNDIPYSVIR
jgi:hypothetical protein